MRLLIRVGLHSPLTMGVQSSQVEPPFLACPVCPDAIWKLEGLFCGL